jgi:hypothetical protein
MGWQMDVANWRLRQGPMPMHHAFQSAVDMPPVVNPEKPSWATKKATRIGPVAILPPQIEKLRSGGWLHFPARFQNYLVRASTMLRSSRCCLPWGLSHSMTPEGVMVQMSQKLRFCCGAGDGSCFCWWAWW